MNILLKFGMLGAEGGWMNSSTREHRAMYVWVKIMFYLYAHSVVCQLTWPHDTLPGVLIIDSLRVIFTHNVTFMECLREHVLSPHDVICTLLHLIANKFFNYKGNACVLATRSLSIMLRFKFSLPTPQVPRDTCEQKVLTHKKVSRWYKSCNW